MHMVLLDFISSIGKCGPYINSALPFLYWISVLFSPESSTVAPLAFVYLLIFVGIVVTIVHVTYIQLALSRCEDAKMDNIRVNPWLLLGGMRQTLLVMGLVWLYGLGTFIVMLTHLTNERTFYFAAAYVITLIVTILLVVFTPKYRNVFKSLLVFARNRRRG